jgi:hypothetical protein
MNIYYFSIAVSSIFFIIKIIQYKYNKDEDKKLSNIIYDSIFVFLSVILGDFLIKTLNPILKEEKPNVFIDNPSF